MNAQSSAWELLAVHEGGTVSSLATTTARDGTTRVFAATAVGVFWSGDGGAHWQPLTGAGNGAVAGAEVVVPSPHYGQDGALYVGGHGGLFRWQEARPGWDHLLSGSRVLGLAVLPGPDARSLDSGAAQSGPMTDPGGLTLLAGTTGGLTLLAGTEEDGVLISRNGGRTWEGANPGLLDLTILALAASPAFHEDGLAFAATPTGLYRTRNGADSWRALELDDDDVTIQCLALSPAFAEDRVLLAGTEEHGLLRSEDGGRSWETVPDLAEQCINAVQFIATTGTNDGTTDGASDETDGRAIAIIATDAGVALSDDGGVSWRAVGGALGAALSVAMAAAGPAELGLSGEPGASAEPGVRAAAGPGSPPDVLLTGLPDASVLLAGLPDAGIARSLDGGATWAEANVGLTASLLVGLACSPDFSQDQTLYAASVQPGVSISRDGGHTWTAANDGLDDLSVSQIISVPASRGGSVLYAATAAGLYVAHDSGLPGNPDDAVSWHPAFPPASSEHSPEPILALAAAAGVVLVARSGDLTLSTDDGVTWTPLTVPFGDARVVALALSPTYDRDGILYAAVSGVARSDGTADLTVWSFGRPGARWERLLDERTAASVQLAVVADGSTGGTLLVGLGTRLLRPRANAVEIRGGVRRAIWDATELPAALAGLAVSPAGLDGHGAAAVYAATGAGVLRSSDGGTTFTSWDTDPGADLGETLGDNSRPAGTLAVAVAPLSGHKAGNVGYVFALGLGGTIWRRTESPGSSSRGSV